jgi:hypothetical protein
MLRRGITMPPGNATMTLSGTAFLVAATAAALFLGSRCSGATEHRGNR